MKKVLNWLDDYLEEVLLVAALAAMAVIMGIPMYFVQAAPLAGFVLSAVRVLQRWIVEFQTVRGKGEN